MTEAVEYLDTELASLDGIRQIMKDRQHKWFVWPDEGAFIEDVFIFNDKHSGEIEYEPLCIDTMTANVILAVHGAVNSKNRERLKEMLVKDRGTFAHLLEYCWGKIEPVKKR